MKHIYKWVINVKGMKPVNFLYRILAVAVCLLCSSVINAYDFLEVDGIYYNFTKSGQVEVTFDWMNKGGYSGNIVIPEKITSFGVDYSVTSIGDFAFNDCSGLKSITIPNSVISIGKNAFKDCSGLKSITIPNSVINIGEGAFWNCSGLKSITIPNSVINIGEGAFWNCIALSSFVIPEKINKIASRTFQGCKSLTSISLPNSVKTIEFFAFHSCSSLSNLNFGTGVETIGRGAFGDCTALTSLTIPNCVSTISYDAFSCCTSLKTVIISNGVTTIEESSFSHCTSLTSLTIPNSVTSIGDFAFSESNLQFVKTEIQNPFEISTTVFFRLMGATLQVPKGTKSLYQQYDGWRVHFSSIVEEGTYNFTISSIGKGSVSYNGNIVRENTELFTVDENSKVTIIITPDNGYKIKSILVNGSIVTASNSYTTTINANTTIEVEFEAIPVTTFTLSIKATGNGSASYGGQTIRGATKSYTVNDGTSVTVSFTPDSGYRIKSLKVNNSSVTAASSYTTTIKANTTIEVEFEAIPATTYTLSIKATGNGSASYGGQTIRGTTKSFTVNDGTSVTVSFSPDSGYRIKSLKVNNSSVTAASSYTTTINANTTIEAEFEAIPATTYTLSIKATGNGSASYSGQTIRGTTKSFTVNEGTSITVSFSPDTGYRIKSLKVNNSSVTAASSYTTTIKANTTIEVEFEAIPITTYTLSIKATGNGSASYSGQTIRGTTKSFTVNEGTSVTVSFTPDTGYRIKSLKVNNSSVTAASSYTTTIKANTTIEVEFEAIPATTYTLSIKATGNGSASYGGQTIRGTTKTYTVNEGTSVTISFSPDNGYRIKSVKVNNSSVSVSSSYSTKINANTTIEVVFEAIPVTNYSLSLKVEGNGYAEYSGEKVRNDTKKFSVAEGSNAQIIFKPDAGNRIKTILLNDSEVSAQNGSYTISNVKSDNSVSVVFEAMNGKFSVDGINYEVASYEQQTVVIGEGDYGLVIDAPEKVVSQGLEWSVSGISNNALNESKNLAAIIWNPSITLDIRVKNPNLLLYVKDAKYAPSGINNVVVGNNASSIVLTESQSGNNFYCPRAFTAQKITYSHRYRMRTGINETKGWETIALPFDVQKIVYDYREEITPFAKWTNGSTMKPFWLYQLSAKGFVEADGIKANTPYIISMPNNDMYHNDYILRGTVTFSAENAEVKRSDAVTTEKYGNRTFIPNFVCHDSNSGYYALNVNNDYEVYQGRENEGSVFIQNLRGLHPFEAYMTSTSGTRAIGIFDDMTTSIKGIYDFVDDSQSLKVYNLSGQCVKVGTSLEEIKQTLPSGVYIVNGKKMIIK